MAVVATIATDEIEVMERAGPRPPRIPGPQPIFLPWPTKWSLAPRTNGARKSIDMGAAHSAGSPASSSTSAIVVSWPQVSPGTAQESPASPGVAGSMAVDPRTHVSRCSCGAGQPTSVLTEAVSSARPFLASAKNIEVFGFV
jgi:hypothetical protein